MSLPSYKNLIAKINTYIDSRVSKSKRSQKRIRNVALATSFIALQIISPMSAFFILGRTTPTFAADTATLFPNGQGTYTAWTGDENDIDETGTPDCEDNDEDGNDNVSTSTTSARESVLIDLSSIPNGSTINTITVEVAYRDGNSSGSNGTFQTFARLNGANTDSGVNLVASSSTCTLTTQNIDVADALKSGATTLEVGVLKTATDDSEVWVGAIRAIVSYTPAPQADLVATKTNNTAGNALNNQPFEWKIRVQNNGAATASFTDNQDILRDERPSAGISSYGTPVVTTSGTTGSFDCTQSDSSNRDLVCEANGAATIPVGAYVDITFSATPNSYGTLSNPRNEGTCKADNNNVVSESNEGNNDCYDSINVNSVANPQLPQSCGLDIALVLDNSTSISEDEMTSMKNAMTAFTSAFVGTPTQFSVTRFATTATMVQAFTSNFTDVNTAINNIPVGGGYTNWEDGLTKAQGTLPNRPNPNLVIFASDGNPNTVIGGAGGAASETTAVNAARVVADSIKTSGTRILALGIGSDLDTPNMEAISGPLVDTGNVLTSDVITSDFATLAEDLAEFASQTCGGTITATKLIDADGDINTTDDRTPASDWTFDVSGNPSNPAATQTDANGQTPAVNVEPGTYSVTETVKPGYGLLSASCSGATNNGSVQGGNAVANIQVAANDIVTCTFINSTLPTLTLVKTVDNTAGGNKTVNDFQAKINGNNVAWDTPVVLTTGLHTASETTLSTYSPSDWSGACASDGTVNLALGENKTCYITNTAIAPILTVTKIVNNPYGNPLLPSAFNLMVNATSVNSGEANTQFAAGNHTISETQQPGYSFTGIEGDCTLTQTEGLFNITLALATSSSCTITNTAIQPKLIVTKLVTNDNSGTKNPSDFTITVTGNSANVPNFPGNANGTEVLLNEGAYVVDELSDSGYEKSFSGDCSGTIAIGETKYCTITNNDVPNPSISVIKYGPATAYEGEQVYYSFWVTNTGDTELNNVGIDDDIATGEVCDSTTLAKGASTWCYATYVVPVPQLSNVVNTVTASGTDPDETTVTSTDSHTLDVLHPAIKVEKSGPVSAYAGTQVTYTFTVTNVGDVSLSSITVNDDIAGAGTYQSGDVNDNQILETTETWIYTAEYTIPANQLKDVVNTVVVCGTQYLVYQDVSRESLQSLVIIDDEIVQPVCASDSHTMSIPQVLATPQAPQPAVLAKTGSGIPLSQLVIPLVLITATVGLAIASRRTNNKVTTK